MLGGLAGILLALNSNSQTSYTIYNPKAMSLSTNGLHLIAKHEGFRNKRYNDVAGKQTIGYGHLIRSGENYAEITREDAERLLREDVAIAENSVRNNVKTNLTQCQFDALISFVYNVGSRNFRESTLLRRINAGDTNASKEFDKWVYAGGRKVHGLANRRANERRMFEGN